jgi:hypothetical protein
MKKRKNKNMDDRYLDLSSKFIQMGQALVKEGVENEDYRIRQMGSFMTMMAGVILVEDDVYDFANVVSMFSARKLLDGLQESRSDMTNLLKDNSTDSYDEFIKRIKRLRDKGLDGESEDKG